jgi:transcriptional regulator with PAS, ATPase and Fis domain
VGDTPDLDTSQQTIATGIGEVDQPTVRNFRLTVVEGLSGQPTFDSSGDRCSLGSDQMNDFVVQEQTVSRFHCEVIVDGQGVRISDLGSRNGTFVDGVKVKEGFLRGGSTIRLGRVAIRFQFGNVHNKLSISEERTFGLLSGVSIPMRAAFALLAKAAKSDSTILLEGETGTGKGQAAASVHQASGRASSPFIVVDCGAIPANLLESELFGHEKGSFTGADARRIGAFEEASGGTIFLDEIGEMPIDLQPKLLRALESKEIRRVGTNTFRPVNVRVIAATNRDLRAEVNASRFRPDLFFRLAVLKIALPPLRQRPEDVPEIAAQILKSLGASKERAESLLTMSFVSQLQQAAWPGNVRELRNYLERYLVFEDAGPLAAQALDERMDDEPIDVTVPYAEARARALARFEQRFIKALLAAHKGRVASAAEATGLDRAYLHKLARKHGLK